MMESSPLHPFSSLESIAWGTRCVVQRVFDGAMSLMTVGIIQAAARFANQEVAGRSKIAPTSLLAERATLIEQ